MLTPWIAHLYTALGAATALLAVLALEAGDVRRTYLWLVVATAIDATDGVLARALRVRERLPWFDGGKLDDLVDFLTYVFVPALIVARTPLVPAEASLPVAVAMLVSSGYGFSRDDAKVVTTDYFFTGFPSYWSIVCVYLHVAGLAPVVNAAILTACVALVFVPVRWVYPTRTMTWRPLTLGLGTAWALCLTFVIWRLPATGGPWLWLSLVFPAYYVLLSLKLSAADRAVR